MSSSSEFAASESVSSVKAPKMSTHAIDDFVAGRDLATMPVKDLLYMNTRYRFALLGDNDANLKRSDPQGARLDHLADDHIFKNYLKIDGTHKQDEIASMFGELFSTLSTQLKHHVILYV
jgi:hypothetical protein